MLQIRQQTGLVGNFRSLLFHFGLLSEDVPGVTVAAAEKAVADKLVSFGVFVNGVGEVVEVKDGKYKSALLLVYLAELAGKDDFLRCESDRKIIEAYFGPEIVNDAVNNPNTTHHTVRALLATGSVRIVLNRP